MLNVENVTINNKGIGEDRALINKISQQVEKGVYSGLIDAVKEL